MRGRQLLDLLAQVGEDLRDVLARVGHLRHRRLRLGEGRDRLAPEVVDDLVDAARRLERDLRTLAEGVLGLAGQDVDHARADEA